MPLNFDFLTVLQKSFDKYLETSARSNEKLKILHQKIARDLSGKLGEDYTVDSLDFGSGREQTIPGRYLEKKVDVCVSKNGKPQAGVAVKFVMSNYAQNSNNYFENMLGETANIRSSGTPYFQIFIIPEKLPYFDNAGTVKKIEEITPHNIDKYVALSNDNADLFFHTPNKTLFVLLKPSVLPEEGQSKAEYKTACQGMRFGYSDAIKSFITITRRFWKKSITPFWRYNLTAFFDTLRRCFPSAWRWSWDRRPWERE